MKTLLLLRHGHAEKDNPGGDHARALDARGHRQTQEVAATLDRLGLRPAVALVSDSRRTRETADDALAASGTPPWYSRPELYGASTGEILAQVHAIPDSAPSAIVVGHNPGIGETAQLLAGSGDREALRRMAERFPTGALAVIDLSVDQW